MALPKPRWTEAQYLAFERTSQDRHEFINGDVVAMSGATERHNRVVGNTFASFYSQIGDRPCSVYASDMRVRVGQRRQYTYPDVVVVCGAVELAKDDYLDILLNPTVIIEVLSPSTEAYDRGAKAELYRTLESLQEYVLISQDKTHFERFTRQPDGQWIFAEISLADGVMELSSIGCSLGASDVYRRVMFDADETGEDN